MTLVAVAAAGNVEEDAINCVERSLADTLGVETRRLERFPEPDYAFDAARNQYSSTVVLRDALRRRPPDAEKLMVITDRDIFIPMLSFVYGQAQLAGPAAVLSITRLRQEFYGLPPSGALFRLRIRKEALHEMGHCFGLTHCSDTSCTMSLSTNIQQLDRKTAEFCSGCTTLLRDAVGGTGVHK